MARAWTLNERVHQCWDDTDCGAAQTFVARWFWWATHSQLWLMAEVAKLIRRHLPNVLTYLRPGITSAGLKTINAVLQWGKEDRPRLPQPGALQDCHLLSQWMGSTAPHTQPGRAIFSSLVLQRPEPHNPPVDITIESCKDEKDEDKEWGG